MVKNGQSINYIILLLLSAVLLNTGCKSNFEKLRASGETEKMYEAANEYYSNGEYLKAQTLYELVLNNYKGQTEAEELYFKYAYTHYYLQKYILAAYYFKTYATTFTTSPHREEAMYMTGYSNYKLSPSFRLTQEYTHKAIDGLQRFVNTYPQSERLEKTNTLIDEMREKLERKAVAAAQLYYDMEDYKSAVLSFKHVLQDFPDTEAEEDIRFKMTKSQYLLAKNSIYEKKEQRAEEVLSLYNLFKKKFPKSEKLQELNNIRENTLNILNELNDGGYKISSTKS